MSIFNLFVKTIIDFFNRFRCACENRLTNLALAPIVVKTGIMHESI